MSMRFNTPVFRPQDNKGRTLPGAQLFFFENYSTTPKTTYANVALTNPNPHPIIADGAGKFTDIFLGIGDYRVILTDRKGQILWDRNDVSVNDLTTDVINDIERQLTEVLNLYRMQNLGEYGVADPDLEKTFTEPNAQYVVYNNQAYWTVSGTPLPYTTDSVTYPNPQDDPNLTLAPNVTFNYVDTGDQDRQKETTGISEITLINGGDDLFPLIGQGIRVAGVGLWIVPSVTDDGSPMPNPANLDSLPVSSNTTVTINGATATVKLLQVEIFGGSVDTFSSKSFPVGAIVKTSFYSADGDPVLGLKYIVEAPSSADGFVNHNDASGNLLRLIFNDEIFIEQAGATATQSYSAINQCVRAASGTGATVKSRMTAFTLEQPLYFLNNEVTNVNVDINADIAFTGVRTQGSEFDWQWGAFTFHGEKTGTSQDVTLTIEMSEGRDFWEVSDSSIFTVGDYIEIEVKPNSSNFADKTYWRMVRVVAIDSPTQIRVNHARGYTVPIGDLVRFTIVNPVQDITVKVKSISFDVPYTPGDQTSRENASSGIAFAYADNCNVESFQYIKNPKQAVHFEFSMYCKSKKVKMFDPIEVNSGGYNTQFSRSIYFECKGLRSSEDRHIFDSTAASNGKLTDCGSWQTTNSSFTTHGTYEHDIEYDKCYGLLQFAGSGASFGENAKRMTVSNHYGNMLRTGNESGGFTPANVYDITLVDCHFISTSDVNLDGLQMYRCEFENDFRTYQQSTLSRRDSVFEDCVIPLGNNSGNFTTRLVCNRTRLDNFDLTTIQGTGELILERSTVNNGSATSGRWLCNLSKLEVNGGVFKGIPIRASDTGNSATFIFTDNVDMDINNRTGNLALFDSVKTSGTLTLVYNPSRSIQNGTDRHVSLTTAGANIRATIGGNGGVLLGGGMNISAGALGSGYLISDSVAYDTVDLANMPADNGTNIRRGTEAIF